MRKIVISSKIKILILVLILGIILISGFWILRSEECKLEKIDFNLDEIHNSHNYEFCVPYEERYLQEIKGIDPTIECYHGPSGEIGCTNAEYLCIGNTGNKDFKSILCKLSKLDYVNRIHLTHWE